jgi:alkanesulfonate monooxygenase SsuD/methylene tetrahydromethanopterin reductase-like flavin-dependent oxidoreductase (luciferase family)
MVGWAVHHDLRAPDFGTEPRRLYQAALEMSEWADRHRASTIIISEHHGSPDGYLPSPLTMAAAVAARTEKASILLAALVLTLRDPVATAEDAIVVDLLSGGRLVILLAPGYVPDECAMFGVPFDRRGAMFEEKVAAFCQALTGEPFDYQGRTITVTPGPLQRPRPPVLMGGGVPRRAARLADGYMPAIPDQALADAYTAECRRLGQGDGFLIWPGNPLCTFVAEDPEKAWIELAPHALHETNAYAKWSAAVPGASPYQPLEDVDALKQLGIYAVVTPDECVQMARTMDPRSQLIFKPLMAGLDPEVGWRSLQLFADKVLPALQPETSHP